MNILKGFKYVFFARPDEEQAELDPLLDQKMRRETEKFGRKIQSRKDRGLTTECSYCNTDGASRLIGGEEAGVYHSFCLRKLTRETI